MVRLLMFLFFAYLVPSVTFASYTTINFDDIPIREEPSLARYLPLGLNFSDTIHSYDIPLANRTGVVLPTSGIMLANLSDPNLACTTENASGSIYIDSQVAGSVLAISARVTGYDRTTFTAYGADGTILGIAATPGRNCNMITNDLGTFCPDPVAPDQQLLSIVANAQIARVDIVGNNCNTFFDDFTFGTTSPGAPTPPPTPTPTPGPNPLNIENLRIAQRVFDPSISGGLSTDLVDDKPYMVEVTLSANVPSGHGDLRAKAQLYSNGVFRASSVPFRLDSVVGNSSKIFIFDQMHETGIKDFDIRIVPVDILPGVFDGANIVHVMKQVTFWSPSLSMLLVQATGCQPLASTCYTPISQSEVDSITNVSIPFANSALPISNGQLTYSTGINWGLSNPSSDASYGLYLDALELQLQKKLIFSKDIGVMMVTTDYFKKEGIDAGDPSLTVTGLHPSNYPGIIFVTANHRDTLAHELTHSLGAANHDDDVAYEGFGSNVNEVWTTGTSLDPSVTLNNLAASYFTSVVNDSSMTISRDNYDLAFGTLLTTKVDPEVVFVGGIVNSIGNSTYTKVARGTAVLDANQANGDVLVQGLDVNGNVLSQIHTRSNNSIELETNQGDRDIQTSSSMYAAVIPYVQGLTQVAVYKNNQLVVKRSILTLAEAVSGLNTNSFTNNKSQRASVLQEIQNKFRQYSDFATSGKKSQASSMLTSVRQLISANCGDLITLSDQSTISKSEILGLIDEQLANLSH